ncbi:MAG: sugar phosphate isomerase/epimerase [Acidobacteria bacterium]|nr:sugar phosphate isomerase/epimerase [Acidobacteriota bacterium]
MAFSTLLHSVSYSGSWGQTRLSVDDFVGKAAELGFHGVMLMAKRPHLSVLDYDAPARKALRRLIEQSGLQAVCIAGYSNFTADLEHAEIPMREMQIHYVTELAQLAHDLGSGLIRIYTGYEHPSAGYLAQWNLVVDALRECADRAAPLGVTIGIQNHHDIAVDYRSQRDLINAIGRPNCKPLFDAWAPALQGADIVEAARVMAPLMPHTTIANYQKRPRFIYEPEAINYRAATPYAQAVPIDEGFIDYAAFLAALREGGFSGTVAYEICSPILGGGSIENLDAYARRFLKFMHAVE